MNDKRNKRFNIMNKKRIFNYEKYKLLQLHGLKQHYKSKKEYQEHVKLIKFNLKMKKK
jgi:hypothetical protein